MKLYRVMNKTTKDWWEGGANSAAEAIKRAGWPAEESWIRERSHRGAGGWRKPKE